MNSTPPPHNSQHSSNPTVPAIDKPPGQWNIPRPTLKMQTLHNTKQRTGTARQVPEADSDDEDSDLDSGDVSWTKEDQRS